METLLEPISDDAPCGVDLSYEPVYSDLATMLEGTPGNQFEENSAKEPNWPAIRKLAEENLKKSVDLQIGVYFTVALMQTTGMPGAARGVEYLAGAVRKYWDNLFPNLDPDDPDPTQRVNILSQLTVEAGSYGDPVKFIERLNAAPIIRVPGLAVTINYLTADPANAGRLPEIMAGGDPEETAAGVEALRRVMAAVHGMDDFLIEKLGRGAAASFDPLIKALEKGLRVFDSLTPAAAATGAAGETGAAGGAQAAGGGGSAPRQAIAGEIQSLDDVRKMLGKIRDYYAKNEPASPVPFLLQRAERLVGKNFLDLLTNLVPNSRSDFETLMGPAEEGS